MENEDRVDPGFVKGFNEGYIIAQEMPELAQVLANIESNSERLNGLKAGQKQYDKEQIEQLKNHMPSWLKGDRAAKNPTAPTKSKGRDIEPDRE